MSVVIETTIGDLTVDLFTEERPVACLNFVKLCKLKYYNYNLFHTIEQGFIAQSGDPTGAGDGGSSLWGMVEGAHKRFFEAETLPKIYHTSAGLLSLVSAGKHLVGSQFFFTLGPNLSSLDEQHCVIGEVVEGHETLRKLNEAIVDENFRPYQDIRITHTVVLEDPFPDPRGFRIPSRSPSPTAERLKNGRIAADEDIDDTDGKSLEEIQEMLAEREAKARATILEIVGDLPDADVAPPENVLFVCKLNPVTTDDDLEIIFSRFGKVKGCEVIRDKKTGDSLQYAFVEFEDQKACEAAFFKMDNVLIDDRRIHVDFSQSVAKVKWRGKGRGVEGEGGRLDFNNLRGEDNQTKSAGKRGYKNKGSNGQERGMDRERMSSAERRKAREERHRQRDEQERRKRRSRSRSRERPKDRRNEKSPARRRNRDRSRSIENKSKENQRRSRSREGRRQSPDQRRNARHSPQRKHNSKQSLNRTEYRRQSPDRECSDRHRFEKRSKEKRDSIEERPQRKCDRRDDVLKSDPKSERENRKRKSKRESSSEESSSESESSSSSSSDSSSSSSSAEEERRRKKSKKQKHHKRRKAKKSKSKKHKK